MLIVFEGGEGAGKGTQIKLLRKKLKSLGYKVFLMVEPGGPRLGKLIRKLLLHREDLNLMGITEAFLFFALRAQQAIESIKPALKNRFIVLSDRSYFSTYAYQGYGRRLDMRSLEALKKIAVGSSKPDLVFLLDVPPEIGLSRKKTQREINRLDKESLAFHHRVRKGYLKMAKSNPSRWKVIDATLSIEDIREAIWKEVLRKLPK